MIGDVDENARVEYSAAHDAYMHYDNFTWQVGAVLIAGIFVYWGFVVSGQPELLPVLLGNLVVCLFMSCWLLYAEHNRQIYLFKLHRIHELEAHLGLCQHRRFKEWPDQKKVYSLTGATGHYIDDAIYVLISLGGLLPSLSAQSATAQMWSCYHWLILVLTVSVVISVICYVHCLDREAKNLTLKLEKETSGPASDTSNTTN